MAVEQTGDDRHAPVGPQRTWRAAMGRGFLGPRGMTAIRDPPRDLARGVVAGRGRKRAGRCGRTIEPRNTRRSPVRPAPSRPQWASLAQRCKDGGMVTAGAPASILQRPHTSCPSPSNAMLSTGPLTGTRQAASWAGQMTGFTRIASHRGRIPSWQGFSCQLQALVRSWRPTSSSATPATCE